ncbi:MAG: RnfABCDGE type electron transport complex subunit G [Synergistaceae bacterium]|jgi:electron transport complex protein RnfG|nr:RnfABCDGE type electron transport complex subunit G [Synergistaceae bacterium]
MAGNNGQALQASANARKIISLGLILFAVTAITGVILGAVYEITLEPIRRTGERLRNEAMANALPEADIFSLLEIAGGDDPAIKKVIKDVREGARDGENAGWCVTVTPDGYGGPIEIVVGITSDGGLRAISILSHSETPGLGAKAASPEFYGQYENKNAPALTVVGSAPGGPDQIQAISGATITSKGVTSGVNAALSYWRDNLAPAGYEGGDIAGISGASAAPEGESK